MYDSKTRVLIVDDMFAMRKMVAKMCKEIGFTDLTDAGDGLLAWEALTAANPPIGLVISDWNMPNCSGLDFLKKVRAEPRYKTLPFLMVTAEADQAQVAQAVKAGVSNYVVKPFSIDLLKEKLEAMHAKTARR